MNVVLRAAHRVMRSCSRRQSKQWKMETKEMKMELEGNYLSFRLLILLAALITLPFLALLLLLTFAAIVAATA